MCKEQVEKMNEDLGEMKLTQMVMNDKGELVTVADYLNDSFSFYRSESEFTSYCALGKKTKEYYVMSNGDAMEGCKEITCKELQELIGNNEPLESANEIDELYLVALYNKLESIMENKTCMSCMLKLETVK